MLQVFIDSGLGEIDYTQFLVSQSISIQQSLNQPSVCTLSLSNNDNSFLLPVPMSYLRIYSTKYNKNLFTGFLTNDPSRTFLGVGRTSATGGQMFTFGCSFTSDEYLLNIKTIEMIPTFVNQPQGYILRTIAESLCPDFFDFTYCASGDIVPFMTYDPTQQWSQIAKTFCDASRYRYSVKNREIHFQPYNDGPLGVKYDEDSGERNFDPFKLQTSAVTKPLINDVIVVGAQEPGNNHEDYFIGTGFDGAFPLRHKVYGLATAFQGSSILLADSWNATDVNTQTWQVQDPGDNFNYALNGTAALNIITGSDTPNVDGTSFIVANNGIELGGGINLQHGEFVFNDTSTGMIGGIYDRENLTNYGEYSLDDTMCEAGFTISPSASVQVTASGAAGIYIQPYRLGSIPDNSFKVTTKVNNSYVLNTHVTAPEASRYNQVFRTIAGVVFGDVATQETKGTITWSVTETDIFSGKQTFYGFSMTDQILPSTSLYVLVNNKELNVTVISTVISAPIPGSLNIKCEAGAGLLSQIYVSGMLQFVGAYVTPSGGNLPIKPDNFATEAGFPLGTGLENQSAEIDSGQVTDTLNFYSDNTPGVGTRIRLQSFESQAAMARVRDNKSIQQQSNIVGDDGLRSAVITNMNPLPRTSEDAEAAAQAQLYDSTRTAYQGTYNASWLFFDQYTDDIEFYPICGRYLYVNSPKRNINRQKLLVTSLTTTVEELADERINYSISFGPDYALQKTLSALVPQPKSVLTDIDTTNPPTPQELTTLGTNYLPDVTLTTVQHMISGAQAIISLKDPIPSGAHYEIRSADLNWGYLDSRFVAQTTVTGDIIVSRTAYEQSWYIRFVRDTLADSTYGIIGDGLSGNGVYFPAKYISETTRLGELVGAFVDSSGNILQTDAIGSSRTLTAPAGASKLLIGINDDDFHDNDFSFTVYVNSSGTQTLQVSGKTMPWNPLTSSYTYGLNNGVAAQAIPVSGGQDISLFATGLISVGPTFLPMGPDGLNSSASAMQVGVSGSVISSRRTKALRIVYPRIPAAPAFVRADPNTLYFDFAGDSRDIEGIELRDGTDTEVYYRAIVGSRMDMTLDLSVLRGILSPGQTGTGPIGQYQYNLVPSGARTFTARFFNLMWEYGPPLSVSTPPPGISDAFVDDTNMTLSWTLVQGAAAPTDVQYLIETDDTSSAFTSITMSATVATTAFVLPDAEFFPHRWIRITPYDSVGAGTSIIIEHTYIPDAVTEFGPNEEFVVAPPLSNTTSATPPSNLPVSYYSTYTNISDVNKITNLAGE